MNLNRGQGLGFKVFGTVIDRRLLVKTAAALAGVATSTVIALVKMGAGEIDKALDRASEHT